MSPLLLRHKGFLLIFTLDGSMWKNFKNLGALAELSDHLCLNGWPKNDYLFLLKIFQKNNRSTMNSHIKNISMGLWLHKEKTHTISKYVQVVCELLLANSLYTHKDFSLGNINLKRSTV